MPSALTEADKARLKVVDIENQLGVQRYLEDTTAEWLLFNGLEENLALSNAKLVLMAIACAAAVLTHFNGMTFPENRWFIAAAIGVYLAISAVLQVMATLWEGDLLMRSIASKTSKWGALPALTVRLTMARAVTTFTVVVADKEGKELAKCEGDATAYFTSEGHFARSLFIAELEGLMQEVVGKKGC